MNFIDRFLNNITMYRLVMYYLMILLAIAAIFGAFGILPYNPIAIIFSTVFLLVVAWATNGILARIMNAHPTTESVYITALILALEPVVAWLTSFLFYGERLGRRGASGALLILAGIALTELLPMPIQPSSHEGVSLSG